MSEKIELSNFHMKNKGALILQCDVEIVPWGLVLREVKFFEKGENYWIGMPSRSWQNEDKEWQNKELIVFKDAEFKDRFRKSISEKIKEAIEKGIDETPKLSEECPF